MSVETGSFPSSIPGGPEWDSLRAEAASYPSWRAMHAGHVIVSTQVEVGTEIIYGGEHMGDMPSVEVIGT